MVVEMVDPLTNNLDSGVTADATEPDRSILPVNSRVSVVSAFSVSRAASHSGESLEHCAFLQNATPLAPRSDRSALGPVVCS